ncbi:DUF3800 domain-containing protein [Agromyces aurantiacus]|uniref:DUF3800 domain-containing protein n=1 Tax=Agromyces aurantiacus TaxID=165814 RepID=A0ABV9R5V7_9MICO|nr:DUF3800 domain-containing protein [Agromyces aurantiacus]MBM7504215.1 hypothetical protein [Agromyces aurantiacus]
MLYAYIDETGDRGLAGKPGSSPIFGMAAILLTEESARAVRAAVKQLRVEFRVPDGVVMSWKEHLKTHARRMRAGQVLSAIPDVCLIYVYCQKDAVTGRYVQDRELFYNYVALKMYKSILWAARAWKGPNERVNTRFGHVRGHDHRSTEEYFRAQRRYERTVPWHMENGLRWVSADRFLESQAADLYGGFLRSAVWPDEFGNVEGRFIRDVWHQIRRGNGNCPVPLGLMSMPTNELVKQFEWYECPHCEAA